MVRFLPALALLLVAGAGARSADLPAGTWAVNVDGEKGELVIKEVGKDGKVKVKLIGFDAVGHWDGKALTFNRLLDKFEGYLVSEPAEKGKVKYTLTGTCRRYQADVMNSPPPEVRVGWYAQITADAPAPAGKIKAEIRGVLVQDGADVYVSVKRKDAFGKEEEARVWVWKSEGEWKLLQHTLKPLYGKEVIATGELAQLPKGHTTSIPEGALYFLGKFEIKAAGAPK
jgi:hypothetical protein